MLIVRRLPGFEDLPLPSRATAGSAGYDLHAAEAVVLKRNSIPVSMRTGISVELPKGFFGLIVGRSGLAFNRDILCAHVGTIDNDFRGELRVLLSWSSNPFKNDFSHHVLRGDRIAQLLVLPCVNMEVREIDNIVPMVATERGTAGFGSTGR